MSMAVLRTDNVRAFENAGVTQARLANGKFDHYTVQAADKPWARLATLEQAIEYARSIGARCVRGTRYGGRGVYVSAVWVEGAN